MTNLRDVMVPKHASQLAMSNLSAEDMFALNQVPNVKLSKEHSKYAMSDLVLEMSHFLDEDLVNRVEVQLVSERLRKEWGLPASF